MKKIESGLNCKIRLIRQIKGLNQENVALELGISQRAFSKIERGDTQLSVGMLIKLSNLFNMKPEEILTFNTQVIIQTNSSINKQTHRNENIGLEDEYVKSLKKEIDFLKTQLKQNDNFIKELMKKLK